MGFFRVLGAIILVALAVGLAGAIFQTGYLAGIAVDGGAPVFVGPGYGHDWHGWGWGFGGGLFGFLGMLFFFILFIGLLRAVFGGGHRHGWGHGSRGGWGRGAGPSGPGDDHHRFGPWEDRAREVHDEWHRRQAAGSSDAGTGSGQAGAPGGPSVGTTA
jgi:hypothetical protein